MMKTRSGNGNCGAIIIGKNAPAGLPGMRHPQAYFERRLQTINGFPVNSEEIRKLCPVIYRQSFFIVWVDLVGIFSSCIFDRKPWWFPLGQLL